MKVLQVGTLNRALEAKCLGNQSNVINIKHKPSGKEVLVVERKLKTNVQLYTAKFNTPYVLNRTNKLNYL